MLRKVCNEIQGDNVLRNAYPFNKVVDELNTRNYMITDCSK